MKRACVKDVIAIMEYLAPPTLALEGDNIGLQVGDTRQEVHTVLLCLDVTKTVIEEAKNLEAELIIAHHPLVFRPLSSLALTTYPASLLALTIRNSTAVYAAHTNLDIVSGGVNDALVDLITAELPAHNRKPLLCHKENPSVGLGRVVTFDSPVQWSTLIRSLKKALSPPSLRVTGRSIRKLKTIAVCGGSGNGLIEVAMQQEVQLLITGELKYHEALQANICGLTTIEAGHYYTEVPVLESLHKRLEQETRGRGYGIQIKVTSHITCPYST